MESEAEQVADRGVDAAMVGGVRRKYRCIAGDENMAPQDATPEVHMGCAGDIDCTNSSGYNSDFL